MNLYRSISALVLLCAYTLLIFHDFIPHTHQDHESKAAVATHEEHGHAHDNHEHSHTDHEHKTEAQKAKRSDILGNTISAHSNSMDDAHHHSLLYRAKEKKDLRFGTLQVTAVIAVAEEPGQLYTHPLPPCRRADISFYQSLLQSANGLRAPPALG